MRPSVSSDKRALLVVWYAARLSRVCTLSVKEAYIIDPYALTIYSILKTSAQSDAKLIIHLDEV